MSRVLIPYTGLVTPVTNEMATIGVGGSELVADIRVRALAGGNGLAAVLAAIILNNGNTGGTGLDGLLGTDLFLNQTQLADVWAMGTKISKSWREAQGMERRGPTRRISIG